jgi:hypothetical protein
MDQEAKEARKHKREMRVSLEWAQECLDAAEDRYQDLLGDRLTSAEELQRARGSRDRWAGDVRYYEGELGDA